MKLSLEASVAALEKAVYGSTYPSESDEPFEVVQWAPLEGPLDSATILAYGHHAETASVEQVEYEEFFAGLTSDEDWWGDAEYETARQFEALKEAVDANLADLKVFRISGLPEHESQVLIYVVGVHPGGFYAGLKTLSTET